MGKEKRQADDQAALANLNAQVNANAQQAAANQFAQQGLPQGVAGLGPQPVNVNSPTPAKPGDELSEEGRRDRANAERQTPSPLAIPALMNPVGVAREYALAVAEICKATNLMPQSRTRAQRLLRMAIELLGE